MSDEKERYIKSIIDTTDGPKVYVTGPYSHLRRHNDKLALEYSDSSRQEVSIVESSTSITENPMTDRFEVTIKLSLAKKEK